MEPEALDELAENSFWYERKRSGLGDEFVAEVDETLARIVNAPNLFGPYEGGGTVGRYQRALVKRFPYVVIFEVYNDEVVVHSIRHGAQEPGSWERR